MSNGVTGPRSLQKIELVHTVMDDLDADELTTDEYQRLYDGLGRLRETDLMVMRIAVAKLRRKMRNEAKRGG